jgi:hypothetical protein
MVQAGLSRAAAKKLAAEYLKMPKTTKTEAKFKAAKAKADVAAYKRTWSTPGTDWRARCAVEWRIDR